MKLEFKKPRVPNYINTDKGMFPLEQLTEEELLEYIDLWSKALRNNYDKRSKPYKLLDDLSNRKVKETE